ncbi:ankyrin repeat domain-containing protein [Turneriella parva]|nr:ankyrin repeat domain-containing protein [Turneriella parva]
MRSLIPGLPNDILPRLFSLLTLLILLVSSIQADSFQELRKVKTQKQAEAFIAKYGINKISGDGATLLSYAAYNSDLKMVRFLLSKGVDPNITSENGSSALSAAANPQGFEIMKALIESGAKINYVRGASPNSAGSTILSDLFRSGWGKKADITPMLIEIGADVNHRNNRGETPLMAALSSDYGQQKAIEILVRSGANVNAQDNFGQTVLHLAAKSYEQSIFQKLLEFDPDANLKYKDGETPLFALVLYGKAEGVKMLVAKGADVDVRLANGKSLLEFAIAVKEHRAKTLPHLLPASKNINAPDSKGNSLLMTAAMLNQLDVVKLLVEHGADMNVKNQYNATPLQIAKMNNYEAIVRYLTSKGAQ